MLAEAFVVEDARFTKLVMGNVAVDKLYTGTRWAEGPAYFPAGKYLLWSDIPNDRLMRFDETDGSVSVFQQPCGYHNGHTIDLEGRLICCEHGGRCVSIIDHDGRRVVLADTFEGRRLNSPNDVVVKSDGSIWFSDPTYGIDGDYEGHRAVSEQDGSFVYRLDPKTGTLTVISRQFVRPNGLAFSPDETLLYVGDTGATHVEGTPRAVHVLSLGSDGIALTGSQQLFECDAGHFDGIRVDRDGNIWAGAADGVQCFAPDGTRLGRIRIPEVVGNIEFGGIKRNRLYICATTSLYAVYLNTSASGRRVGA